MELRLDKLSIKKIKTMNQTKKVGILLMFAAVLTLCFSCGKKQSASVGTTEDYSKIDIPQFSADSAYAYVKAQCDFGPRVPNSKAAKDCGDYIIGFMKQYADTVIVQSFSATLWNGNTVEGRNIIASFNPDSETRVLMAAHWDSRLWADHDPEEANHHTPILGANDGASGVGVLMEIARVFKTKACKQGLDIVFFDLEDQGSPQWSDVEIEDQSDWCLGSQHWAKNPHTPFYRADYGILLDMVGYKNARFTKEAQSMYYASSTMNKIWDIASAKGYSDIFVSEKTYPIMDDHVWVNQIAKIPMIDIVQNDVSGSFFPYWHTLKDDMEQIDRRTLKIVADVCLTAIYSGQ